MVAVSLKNAFDGKDADFVNKEGHDATGRYVPYFARSGDKIVLDPLKDYDKAGPGDYYQIPKSTGKDLLTEPYLYPINGKDVLMTSVMLPILDAGKFLGVTGVDTALDGLSADLSKIKPLDVGYVALFSSQGAVVSHPDPKSLGKALKESGLDAANYQKVIDNPGQVIETLEQDGTVDLSVAHPVQVVAGTNWYVVVSVPKAAVFAKLTQLAWISAALILFGVVFLFFSSSSFDRRSSWMNL